MSSCRNWDRRTRTSEMPESESGALPTWLYPNIFVKKNWAGRARTYEMPESKSGALPLGYSPIYTGFRSRVYPAAPIWFAKSKGWVVGFEPTTSGTTIRRSNQLNYTHREKTARLGRFEPPTYCLEGSCSIRLSYRRIVHPAV